VTWMGAWRLVSVDGTDATFHFAYDHPTGIITYDRAGRMAVQIDIKGVRTPFVGGLASGTNEEKVAAFDNYIAYYGTYEMDVKAQTITRHFVKKHAS
jgi:lipocalin-like protein